MSLRFISQAKLPTEFGTFQVHVFEHKGQEHLALVMGSLSESDVILTRIHSECLTGDGLFSLRCDCGPQLAHAMQAIQKAGQGVLIYLRQEGRGIGLTEKIKAYQLQDQGLDTFDANIQLGHAADSRDYDMLKEVFDYLKIKQVDLMTNNPEKIEALESQGITVHKRIPLHVGQNPHNKRYIDTKRNRFKHLD